MPDLDQLPRLLLLQEALSWWRVVAGAVPAAASCPVRCTMLPVLPGLAAPAPGM